MSRKMPRELASTFYSIHCNSDAFLRITLRYSRRFRVQGRTMLRGRHLSRVHWQGRAWIRAMKVPERKLASLFTFAQPGDTDVGENWTFWCLYSLRRSIAHLLRCPFDSTAGQASSGTNVLSIADATAPRTGRQSQLRLYLGQTPLSKREFTVQKLNGLNGFVGG